MMLMWLIPILLIVALLVPGNDIRTSRTWGAFAIALLLIPVLGGIFMMGGYGMHNYAGWNWTSSLMGLLLIGGLALLIYFQFKRSGSGGSEEEQILRLRLAKGEISPEEYDLLREKLTK